MQNLHKIIRQLLTTTLVLVLSFVLGTANVNAKAPQDIRQLDKQLVDIVAKHKLPSLSYAVLEQGKPLHQRSIGFANIQSKQAASIDTSYRIASVSKMIVGLAIMQLVESKQLTLEDELKTLLPDLQFRNQWQSTHPIKLVHLMENTTGWDEIALQEFAYNNESQLPLAQALALYPDSRTSRWPPGTRHTYTNSAATVAALIVETVTDMPFDKYVQQYIFSPLEISTANYSNDNPANAKGYGPVQQEITYKPILMTPSGGLTISLNDLSKILHAFIVRSPSLLSSDSYQRIEHSHSTNAGIFPAGYGIFNYARYYQGWRFRGHDGALPGWRSELSYSPEFKSGFVVLQNSENDAAFRAIITAISNFVIANWDKPSLSAADQSTTPQEVTGYYRYQNPRNAKRYFIERLAATNKLSEQAESTTFTSVFPPGWRRDLHYAGDNRWKNDKGEVVMIQTTDPQLGKVFHYGDRVFSQVSGFSAWIDKVLLVLWLLCLIITLPVAIFWLIRLSKKHYQNTASEKLRCAVLLASLSAWLFIFFLAFGLLSPINRLGGPTWISIGLMLSSLLLVAITMLAIRWYAKNVKLSVGKFANVFATILLPIQLIIVVYLGWYGVIGVQSWT
ncbi:serine hydrolase domain-containing protein [Thalassotalea sp. Y01]|uniref:serine hydrolase domain-containing protein n=1 Tax=Thalassotalea sp. Y01 TaxID=2729613 RepID=UPI00145E7EF9|nr:serine hydrolase domain-containing protein [Thalassotalea sp. Y01]NMP15891.1 beta-lactamase family protein [Thalassotalea sp. Y01]